MSVPYPELLQKLRNTKVLLETTTSYSVDDMALNFPEMYVSTKQYYSLIYELNKSEKTYKGTLSVVPLAEQEVPFDKDKPLIILCVDFEDMPAKTPISLIEKRYNDPTYSVTQMYKVICNNDYSMSSKVYGWIRVPGSITQYSNYNTIPLVEKVISMISTLPEYSDIKSDILNAIPDGMIDKLGLVGSGSGTNGSHPLYQLGFGFWAHVYSTFKINTFSGLSYSRFMMNSEFLRDYVADDYRIGGDAHELGHIFYLPDLYALPWGELKDYSLMSNGIWLNDARTPAMMDAYSRYRLYSFFFGSKYNRILYATKGIVPVYESKSLLSNIIVISANRYITYYIDYRQKKGYDLYIPGEGLNIISEEKSNVPVIEMLSSDGTGVLSPNSPYLSNPSNTNIALTKNTNPSTAIKSISGLYAPLNITDIKYSFDKSSIAFKLDICTIKSTATIAFDK